MIILGAKLNNNLKLNWMNNNNKILIIGDLHFKDSLGYAEFIDDGRKAEKAEILDFVISQSSDCDSVIFLGDQLNGKHNSSKVIKEFVEFIERFGDKKLYFLAGNHEVMSSGRSSIDFLKEISGKNWGFAINDIEFIGKDNKYNYIFCPYFTKSALGVDTNEEGTKIVMDKLSKFTDVDNAILFVHHAMSDSLTVSGGETNLFNEIVLPKKELEKMFKLVIAGHIHNPQSFDKTFIVGSIFNNEVNELKKYIYKLNSKTCEVDQIELPGRSIIKVENPKLNITLPAIDKNNIIKIIITDPDLKVYIDDIKKEAEKFDAYILLEQYPNKRKKLHYGSGESILEFDINELLKVYAKEKSIDINKLNRGFELINK